ncbi:hypothetical protein VTH82DRAFT_1236 [Thermothelomyces myriococcoides]
MVFKVGACLTCGPYIKEEFDRRPNVIADYQFRNSKYTWTVNIAGDPRTADPKSLFMMAWRKAVGSQIFRYHKTKVTGNMVHCASYIP